MNFAGYVSATSCHRYGPDGPQAFTTYTEDVFTVLHRSLGICNCRQVVGGSSYSHHAECRAADSGFDRIEGRTFAYDYAVLLGGHGRRVGIDHIITNRQPWASGRGQPIIFSAASPNGRTYTGAHPHKDHNHTGFTRGAAANLTYGTLVAVYGSPQHVAARLLGTPIQEDELLPLQYGHGYSSPPAQRPDETPTKVSGDQSHRVEDVRALQDLLNLAYNAGLTLDGVYGPATVAAVKTHLGDYTGNSDGQDGYWVGGNQWGNLQADLAKQYAAGTVDSTARAAAAEAKAVAEAGKASGDRANQTLDKIRKETV